MHILGIQFTTSLLLEIVMKTFAYTLMNAILDLRKVCEIIRKENELEQNGNPIRAKV